MKKAPDEKVDDELRSEYDLALLKGGVRGKYLRQTSDDSNLILIEPELAAVFPDAEAVNDALRLLVKAAEAATKPARRRRRAGVKHG